MMDKLWLLLGKAPQIPAQEFNRWLQEGRAVQVLDARTHLEYQQGTISNAQHAPLNEMPGSLERVPLDISVPVVVLCLSGHRSRPGTIWLRERGYEAYSLQGGVLAWRSAGFTTEKPH